MAVWAFACKLESSQNRWFDGTDQNIYMNDSANYVFKKNVGSENDLESVSLEEVRSTGYRKYITPLRTGVGSMLFNEAKFNELIRRISDFSNSVKMEDSIFIEFSRAIINVNDDFYLNEYINRDFTFSKEYDIDIREDAFINVNDSYGQAIDETLLREKFSSIVSKTFHDIVNDSISFDEVFYAGISGKSVVESIGLSEVITKDTSNVIGDGGKANPIGSLMFNVSMFNAEKVESSIVTELFLSEEVQIILT